MVTTISAIRNFFCDPDVQNEFARWQAAQEGGGDTEDRPRENHSRQCTVGADPHSQSMRGGALELVKRYEESKIVQEGAN